MGMFDIQKNSLSNMAVRRKIMQDLRKHPLSSAGEVARRIKMRPDTTRNHLKKLHAKGLVSYTGYGNLDKFWKVRK